jgi:hypothetical protein
VDSRAGSVNLRGLIADERGISEVVRGSTEAFNARDFEAFGSFFDPDLKSRRPLADAGGSLPNYPGSYHGRDEFMALLKEVVRSTDLVISIRQFEEGENGLVLIEILQTFGPEDAREHQISWVVNEITGGLVRQTASYATEAEARRGLERGLPPA